MASAWAQVGPTDVQHSVQVHVDDLDRSWVRFPCLGLSLSPDAVHTQSDAPLPGVRVCRKARCRRVWKETTGG